MPIFANFRSSMAAGGASLTAEETLITWSGTNGDDYPTVAADFDYVDISDATNGAGGIYEMVGDNNGTIAAVGNYKAGLGVEMMVSDDSGANWTSLYLLTYDQSFGAGTQYARPGYATCIDGILYFVGKQVILVGDPSKDLTSASNWDIGDTDQLFNSNFRQFNEAQLDGVDYFWMSSTNGERRYTTKVSGKDYTANSNWTTEYGNNSQDWTASVVLPKEGATNGDQTVLLLNTAEAYFSNWTDNSGEPYNSPVTPQLVTDSDASGYHRNDGVWAGGRDSNLYYLPTNPSVSQYDSWTEVDLSSSGYTGQIIKNFTTNPNNNTTMAFSNSFMGLAKNPKNVGGADGWRFYDMASYGWTGMSTMCFADGKYWMARWSNAGDRGFYTTPGWTGDEVTVTFDTQLAANPIKYFNNSGESSATVNDKSLYDALQKAIADGDLTGVTVTYNNGTNNGTGVKIVNDEEESYANITITGASSTATINTYIDN